MERSARLSAECPQVEGAFDPQPASRNLHQSPQAGGSRKPHANGRCGGAPTRSPGDLWRFRKANPLEDKP